MSADSDPIRQFQLEVRETIERAERLRPIVRACQDAIARADVHAVITVGKRNKLDPKIEIMVFCNRLDETVGLFRELAKEGLRTDKSEPHKDHHVHKVIAIREYNLGPDVSVIATLVSASAEKSDDPACRIEQVGVREVPVYEIKCD